MRRKLIVLLIICTNAMLVSFSQKAEEPSGKISGLIFGDYYYNLQRDTGFSVLKNTASSGKQNVFGAQIRRIYFTYDYKFNPRLSTRFRLESDDANFTVNNADKANKFSVFIKDAWVSWKYLNYHSVVFGIQGTPSFEVSESIWNHRFLEKTILDLRGIAPSRDLAIGFKGQFDSTGIIKYWLVYANNSASKPETDKYKRIYGHLEIRPQENIIITTYADYQFKAATKDSYNGNVDVNNDIFTTALFLGYQVKNKYTIGIEPYYSQVSNGYDNGSMLKDKNGFGFTVLGYYQILSKITVVGRYDYFEPNTSSSGDTRHLIIAGIDYKPFEKFIITPNVVYESYEKIGTWNIKSSITPRLTFYWIF